MITTFAMAAIIYVVIFSVVLGTIALCMLLAALCKGPHAMEKNIYDYKISSASSS